MDNTCPCFVSDVLYLFSDSSEQTYKIFASKQVVFVGLISYSLYLWHQPLLVFYRFNVNESIGIVPFLTLLIITFFLSVLSYYLIEKPFRSRRYRLVKWMVLVPVLPSLLFVALYIEENQGLPNRLGALKSIFYSMNDRKTFKIDGKTCHAKSLAQSCYTGEKDKSKGTILLIGDSHAATLSKNLYEQSIARGYGYRQITHGVALP